MSLTTTQINNLNNSMVAAQDVALGTLMNAYSSNKVVSGSFTPEAASTPIATGLTTVSYAVACLSGSPSLNCAWASVTTGSVAGTIVVALWKPTASNDVSPAAADGFAGVNWIAVGE